MSYFDRKYGSQEGVRELVQKETHSHGIRDLKDQSENASTVAEHKIAMQYHLDEEQRIKAEPGLKFSPAAYEHHHAALAHQTASVVGTKGKSTNFYAYSEQARAASVKAHGIATH